MVDLKAGPRHEMTHTSNQLCFLEAHGTCPALAKCKMGTWLLLCAARQRLQEISGDIEVTIVLAWAASSVKVQRQAKWVAFRVASGPRH